MLTILVFGKKRKKTMSDFSDNLMVIALKNDKVMPLEGIRQAIGEKLSESKLRVLHFPYDYTHENPFPVLYKKLDKQVVIKRTIGMRNKSPRNAIDAWQTRQWLIYQDRECPEVASRKTIVNLFELSLNQVKVVQQPFSGRTDVITCARLMSNVLMRLPECQYIALQPGEERRCE
jgi:hypothetical protein